MGQGKTVAEIHTQHHRQAAASAFCFFPPNPRPALSDHCMIDGGTFSVWGFSARLFFAA